LITNLVNGKVYVGQTWGSVSARWTSHLHDAENRPQFYFHRALNKYGKENFVAGVLGWAKTEEELNDLEILWILLLDSADRKYGYNSTHGGRGGKFNSEAKEKMSEAHRRRYEDPAERKRQSDSMKRMWSDPDIRKNILAGQTKWLENPQGRPIRSKRAKQVANRPEIKQKMSENMTKRWSDPEKRQKQSEKSKEALADPKVRKKISEGTRKGLEEAKLRRKEQGIVKPKRVQSRNALGKFIKEEGKK
jgi:group I intron endonuclease